MADREYNIKIRSTGLEQVRSAVKSVGTSFTELNQALEIGRKAFNLVEGAFNKTFQTLERAQSVEGVSRGFETLQRQAGLLADDSLAKLRSATQGLVTDFELMRNANQAVQLGLDPTTLDTMAAAASKLGAAVGRTANEAFQDLITGVGRASPLILDNLGITVKAAEAQEIYAKANNKSVKTLNELEKQEAFRFAALQKIIEKSKELDGVQETAAASATRLKTSFANLEDRFSTTLSQSSDLKDGFDQLSETINSVDVSTLAEALGVLVGWMAKAAKATLDFGDNLENLLGKTGANLRIVIESTKAQISQAESLQDLRRLQGEYRDKLVDTAKALKDTQEEAKNTVFYRSDVNQRLETLQGQMTGYVKSLGLVGKAMTELKEKEEQYSKLNTKKTFEDNAEASEDAKKALAGLRKEYEDFIRKTEISNIQDALDVALDNLDKADFDKLTEQMAESIEEGYLEGQREAIAKGGPLAREQAEQTADAMSEEYRKRSGREWAEAHRKAVEEGWAELGDFIGNVLRDGFDGAADDLEDILASAIGNAIEYGFSNYGAELEGLFGSVFGDSGGGAGASAAGSAGGAGGAGDALLSGDWSAVALSAWYYNMQHWAQGWEAFLSGDGGSDAVADAAFGFTGVPSLLDAAGISGYGGFLEYSPAYPLLSGFGSGKSERERRADAYKDFLNESDITNDFRFDLFGSNQQGDLSHVPLDTGDKNDPRNIGLGNLISQLTTGGSSEFGGLFGNALEQADSYNAALLTTIGLLEQMGLNASQAKEELTALYLDGELALEEYNASFATLSTLQLEDLENAKEGWQLLADTIDGPPRDSVKAFELLLQEAMQEGVQDVDALASFFTNVLGPEAEESIRNLATVGIDQFTDFSTLSVEQINLLVNEIDLLASLLEDRVASGANTAGNELVEAASRGAGEFRELGRVINGVGTTLDEVTEKRRRFDAAGSGAGTGVSA